MSKLLLWYEIPSLDFERAVKFYSTILNKEITARLQTKEGWQAFIPKNEGEQGMKLWDLILGL